MTIEPKIPMLPSELPQQRIHEIVDIEPRPERFEVSVGYEAVPNEALPKGNPRSPIYLCQVEWAWSPMHSRIDAYYLQRGRKFWVLWSRYWDDNWGRWEWIAVACVHRKGVTERQAAFHLLIEFWVEQVGEAGLDQFHWINEAEYLSVAELAAISRIVWE